MNFDDLDKQMRVYETASDQCVLPGVTMVARLDGRGFTRLTKELMQFEAPFDVRFRDAMIATVRHLMDCGFPVRYAYTESDEISLLFDQGVDVFGRKLRKFNSVLAGEASAAMSLALGRAACFDCRVSQLPRLADVVTYFRWRAEDASRNALNGYCYWALRKEGVSARAATAQLSGLSVSGKNEWLFARGINFNDQPVWQKRGIGFYWETYAKQALDPRTGESVTANRRRIKVDLAIPMGLAYADYVQAMVVAGVPEELRA